ncbi:MAG TPA: tRNA pseudouridine(38-40) synthase TruA [Armatimonadota bacterium]|jgi:tRNA pseudouridine38-40 synthase
MRTLALTVSYDGTDWCGFQRQRDVPSIQGAVEAALSEVFQHKVAVFCAGRTDAGVHAIGQVVSFPTPNLMPLDRITWVTNRLLPATIRIRRAQDVPPNFHARFSARFRRYWYVVQSTGQPDPIYGRFRWQQKRRFDIAAMETALTAVQGCHDFAAFCHRLAAPTGSTIRTLHRAFVRPWAQGVIIDVQADAFLHQMVRLLVANVLLVGGGERPVTWLEELLQSRDRHLAGKGAPPCGLFLMRIGYFSPTVNPRWGSILEKLNDEMLFG